MTSSLWVGVSTLWVSTFLYGIYLVLLCRCMYIFYKTGMKRSGSRSAALPLLLSAIIMFILSTITVLLFLLQGATAYGAYAISEEAANQRVEGLELAGAVVYVTNNLLADALLIYRCYIIWNTIWITLVPLILLIATMIPSPRIRDRTAVVLYPVFDHQSLRSDAGRWSSLVGNPPYSIALRTGYAQKREECNGHHPGIGTHLLDLRVDTHGFLPFPEPPGCGHIRRSGSSSGNRANPHHRPCRSRC